MERIGLGHAVPVLRVRDADAAARFYVDHLGFARDWEHRFAPELPLYLQVVRGDCTLHLSEHEGDGTPHAAVWIPVDDVHALHADLQARGIDAPVDEDAPGGATLTAEDPDGNQLRFCRPA